MTIEKTEPPPTLPDIDGMDVEAFPDLQDLLPMLLGQTDIAPDGCDTENYLAMLDKKLDIHEDEKRALIHMLWQLCETVIGVQFGVDPEQIALAGQTNRSPKAVNSVVNLQPETQKTFERAARDNDPARKKG